MKKRVLHLDAVKTWAMFLVVFGHIIVNYDVRGYSAPAAQVIYSFHTAMFMFVSGWFFSNNIRKKFLTVMKEKIQQLILPYFCWSFICLVLIEIPMSDFDIRTSISKYLMGGLLSYYWYIKILFIYIIVTYLTIKVIKNKWIACLVCLILFSMLPNFSFSRVFIPFFLAGYLGREFIEKHDGWVWIVGLLFIDLALAHLWETGYGYTGLNMELLPWAVRTLIGIVTSYLVIIVTKKLFGVFSESNRFARLISYVGTITLGIYLCHDLFYKGLLQIWVSSMLPLNNYLAQFLYSILVFALSAVLITLIGKNKYTACILLGKKIDK